MSEKKDDVRSDIERSLWPVGGALSGALLGALVGRGISRANARRILRRAQQNPNGPDAKWLKRYWEAPVAKEFAAKDSKAFMRSESKWGAATGGTFGGLAGAAGGAVEGRRRSSRRRK